MKDRVIDLTENFSVGKLEILTGTIQFNEDRNSYSIILRIAKFILDDRTIETEIRLDRISLSEPLSSHAGKTISFPINPTEGYIDGSIYLRDAHNPVDVSAIKFQKIENGVLSIELIMNFVFEFEGIGFKNEATIKQAKIEII